MEYALRSVGLSFSDGHVLHQHSHPWGQLIFAASGTMRVLAGDALWLVPPGRALWAPAGVRHEIQARGALAMRTIYVPPARGGALPATCAALAVDGLLRELILHIVGRGLLRADDAQAARLADVFLDRLVQARTLTLHLPMPRDARARKLAARLCADPSDARTLPALARLCGLGPRSVQRLFLGETGMRFVEWRQRLRLIQAVAALEMGASVTAAGAEAGYAGTSAFIAAFRQQMGATPARYARTRRGVAEKAS